MLRPERMSKVSVTGAKPVMDDVIGTVHDLNAVDLSDYDGSWEGFVPGDPIEGAEDASEKLVTVRSLQSTLGVEDEDAGPQQVVTEESLESELEAIRQATNELDDRRDELEDRLREIEDELDSMALFRDVGIDLDLLWGYDTLDVAVGTGDADAVEAALADAEEVDAYETFAGAGVDAVAVFARLVDDETSIGEALVGVEFETVAVPEAEGTPDERVRELEAERGELESKLEDVEDEIDELREEAAGFLLAAEETLAIEVQKTEAPLQFATTKNSFVAEGWIPTERYDDFVAALHESVGEHVEIEELERASYSEKGHPEEVEEVEEPGAGGPGEPTAAADGGEARTDGGHAAAGGGGVVTMDDDPPVVLDNPRPASWMELLVDTVGRPNYTEFDPTWLLFLTFPVFFGYMIGDFGYGLGYAAVGYWMMTSFDSEAIRKLGGIGVLCGVSTAAFGVLYGELFGLHVFGEIVWGTLHEVSLGALPEETPIHKGLTGHSEFAIAWLLITLIVGLLHVTLGHVLSFVKELQNHGASAAVFESGSWIVLLAGVWGWVFVVLPQLSPELVHSAFGPYESTVIEGHPAFALGFTGLPEWLNLPFLAVIAVGAVMLAIGEREKSVEILQVLVNVLSYLRLMAVLLAKAGMAFVVNLFVFGAYEHHGSIHFMTGNIGAAGHVPEGAHPVFAGLFHLEGGALTVVGLIGGLVLLVVGHLIVFALGITSAGLQAIRLEYVEFFNKFYDGGGRTFNPFGYVRQYTTED